MKVQISTKGQYYITIPKALALAKGFNKGDKVQWQLDKQGDLVLSKD